MEKNIIGRTECPCCGTKDGMRFTLDRNGKPFGYCDAECRAQLRVGGDARREKLFAARYPWANGAPVTVTASAPAPEPEKPVTVTDTAPRKKKPEKPVTVTQPIPAKRATWADSLAVGLGALGIQS